MGVLVFVCLLIAFSMAIMQPIQGAVPGVVQPGMDRPTTAAFVGFGAWDML